MSISNARKNKKDVELLAIKEQRRILHEESNANASLKAKQLRAYNQALYDAQQIVLQEKKAETDARALYDAQQLVLQEKKAELDDCSITDASNVNTLLDNKQKSQDIIEIVVKTPSDNDIAVHRSHANSFKSLHIWACRLIQDYIINEDYKLCNKLHDIFKKVLNGLIEINKLYERMFEIHIMPNGIEITVRSDDFCVCVYFTVPPTHKNFENINTDTYGCTYYKLLTSGSKQIGWDFGVGNAMIPYKFNKILQNNKDNIEVCVDLIQELRIITIEDVKELITENLAYLNR